MPIASSAALDREFDHESVNVFHDPRTGATGVVAIHSTALGPAMGGLRLHRYGGLDDAVADALRLARAMTLKNAAAGLDLGGGKAVLLDDGAWRAGRAERLAAVGRAIDALGGRYVTAEDVGTSPGDMDVIATQTQWVAGRSAESGGRGDPSLSTARTVFGAIAAAVDVHLGRPLEGAHVGVLGVGHVGSHLVALLRAAGARVSLTDVDGERARRVAEQTGSTAGPLDGFLAQDLDVFAPCAMGEVIGAAEVGLLRCAVVCGAANNPLAEDGLAADLAGRDILYVPDFIANCGGIVYVAGDFAREDEDEVDRRIAGCIERTRELLVTARDAGRPPVDVARELAAARLASATREPAVAA
jgi:glutamate dehydrogenase/leucine dehydrogenase